MPIDSGRSFHLFCQMGSRIAAPSADDFVAQGLRTLATAQRGHHLADQSKIGQRMQGLQLGSREYARVQHFAEPELELQRLTVGHRHRVISTIGPTVVTERVDSAMWHGRRAAVVTAVGEYEAMATARASCRQTPPAAIVGFGILSQAMRTPLLSGVPPRSMIDAEWQ